RQWATNRENAQKSSGPRTEEGKRRSRHNALRHGLTAETVVESLEDPEDYSAFEAAIIADYDATTAVDRELVLRLAALLWRIRRATGIETALLCIQAEIIRARCRVASPPSGYRVLRPVMTAPPAHEAADLETSPSGGPADDDLNESVKNGPEVRQ